MTTALEALATRLTALETDLAGAATAAEVEALQTALAAAQSDLTELLASNNVYSNDLTINSQATLDVAKSLGGKLAIINGGVTITQSSSMDAEDLQAVVDVMVTVTGSITYTMDVNGSTQAVFNNLTSVGGLNVDVSGAINFPELQNAGAVVLEDTHKNYVTSVEFPKLSKVTSFATASAANTISFSKATAITLSELANYANSSLTISGKLDFALDLAKLTSKTAAGVKNKIALTVSGAKELTLPEFTEGTIIANSTEKVVLAKFVGSTTATKDSFAKAEYLHLDAYEQTYTSTSTSLETMIFGGVAETSDVDSGDHPSLNLTDASGLTTLTVKGKLYALTLSGNTSLSDVTVSGAINSVTVTGATSLEALTLAHTGAAIAADKDEADLTITNNTELATLTVDSLVSVADLTITGNTSLETISFAKLTGVGVDAKSNVNVSNNNLTATSVNKTGAGSTTAITAAGGVGSIETESGMDDLKAYLAAAAKSAAAVAGSEVYASFDTVETYIDTNDAETGPFNFTADAKGTGNNVYLEVVYVSPATSDSQIKNSYAEVLDITDGDSTSVTLTANGASVEVTNSATEITKDQFIAKLTATTLPNATVSAGVIDRRSGVEIATVTSTSGATLTATILLGSAGYSSATATPTTAALSKAVVSVTVSTSVTLTAQEFAAALNSSSTYLESFNSSTYSNTDNYTTTTTLFSDKYAATVENDYLVIAKKAVVITTGTATGTVVDRTATAIPFSLFNTGSVANAFTVEANSYKEFSNTYVKITDNLFGGANTPGFGITQNAAYNPVDQEIDINMPQVVAEEWSAYSATTGAGTTRVSGVAKSGALVRATEFNLDNGVDANKKNITSWL